MNLLYVFGAIGGILYLIAVLGSICKNIIKAIRNFYKYKSAYMEKNSEQQETIGFKTESEQTKKEEVKFNLKLPEDYSSYWKYWESIPVDDEFIEDEEYEEEDELDKYPLLKDARIKR